MYIVCGEYTKCKPHTFVPRRLNQISQLDREPLAFLHSCKKKNLEGGGGGGRSGLGRIEMAWSGAVPVLSCRDLSYMKAHVQSIFMMFLLCYSSYWAFFTVFLVFSLCPVKIRARIFHQSKIRPTRIRPPTPQLRETGNPLASPNLPTVTESLEEPTAETLPQLAD